jgi:RecB family exonuclease
MTDVTQKNWPGVIHSSPLLDAPEREAMTAASAYLPSVHDKHVQKEALFRRLLQMGENLTVISHATTDEDGRPAGLTSFVESFLTDMKLWRLDAMAPVGIGGLAGLSSAGYFPAIEVETSQKNARVAPVVQSAPISEETPIEKLRFPVSSLYDLLDCPLRYWLKRNAGLKERTTSLFSEAEAGQLTHKIWEEVWRCRREDAKDSLPCLVVQEWQRAMSLNDDYLPFERLLKDSRLTRHRENLEFYVTRLAETQQAILDRLAASGLQHSSIETETTLTPYETDGITFTGRCDRVEIFEGDYVVIVDYKWGKSSSYEKKLTDLTSRRYLATKYETFRYGLQLSAYALMYAAGSPQRRVVGVGFLGHKDGTLAGTFTPPAAECYLQGKKNVLSLQERTQEALEAMKCAAIILKTGRYEPCYATESCRHCNTKGVCRKGELYGDTLTTEEEATLQP